MTPNRSRLRSLVTLLLLDLGIVAPACEAPSPAPALAPPTLVRATGAACYGGFAPPDCTACRPGYFGPRCQPCPGGAESPCGQAMVLLADLDDDGEGRGFAPIATVGDVTYFRTDDALHGAELWRTDGTAEGTRLVRDIAPGPADGLVFGSSAVVGERLYLVADDGTHGPELWQSDGTEAGTTMVADLVPGSAGAAPSHLLALGDRLYFFSRAAGQALRVFDGTTTTVLVDGLVRFGGPPVVFDGRVVFAAGRETVGPALWATDGTPEGTAVFADVFVEDDDPIELTVVGETLFLSALVPGGSRQLWRSDGTADGTRLVDYVASAPRDTLQLVAAGARVFYVTDTGGLGGELHVSDGTAAGTHRVLDLCPGPCDAAITALASVGGVAYFAADDGDSRLDPWRSDGTPEGTWRLADLGSTTLYGFRAFGGGVVFAAYANGGRWPFWTDGTPAGTVRLPAPEDTEMIPGEAPEVVGDTLYVGVYAGALGRAIEVWRAGGTCDDGREGSGACTCDPAFLGAACELCGPNREGPACSRLCVWPAACACPDGWFGPDCAAECPGGAATPCRGHGTCSAGPAGSGACSCAPFFEGPACEDCVAFRFGPRCTEECPGGPAAPCGEGLVRVFRSPPESELRLHWLTGAVGDRVLFGDGSGTWASDGTPEGTERLTDALSEPHDAFSTGGRTYFPAYLDDLGHEPWVTDGTPEGTELLVDALPGMDGSTSWEFVPVGPWVYFSRPAEPALWRTDGTAAGTHPVGAAGGDPFELVAWWPAGDALVLAASDAETGTEPWWSDGTPEGTYRIADLEPGPAGSDPRLEAAREGVLYLSAETSALGRELWRTAGPAAAPALVADLAPGPESADPTVLFAWDERLYVAARAGGLGRELWSTDGTAEGTWLVADLAPDERSGDPVGGVVLDEAACFFAEAGRVLWRTDGTPEGTFALADLFPGDDEERADVVTWGSRLVAWTDPMGASPALCYSDGTPEGTACPALGGLRAVPQVAPVAFGGGVLFVGAAEDSSWELWRTDGTPEGTLRLAGDLLRTYPRNVTVDGDRAYFRAFDPVHGEELRVTDGTRAGTRVVGDLGPGPEDGSASLPVRAGEALFVEDNELFRVLPRGTCGDGPDGDGLCECPPGLGGAACDECADGTWGYPTCRPCAPCEDDGDVCTADRCDPLTGACAHPPITCDDGRPCSLDTCAPGLGCRFDTSACACDGDAGCDDGDACNGAETCDVPAGTCRAGLPLACDDGDACTGAESCDPTAGCVPGPAPDCDDANPCTDDGCADDECTHVANEAPCDDGDACTLERCADGRCAVEGPADGCCFDNGDCPHDGYCEHGRCWPYPEVVEPPPDAGTTDIVAPDAAGELVAPELAGPELAGPDAAEELLAPDTTGDAPAEVTAADAVDGDTAQGATPGGGDCGGGCADAPSGGAGGLLAPLVLALLLVGARRARRGPRAGPVRP